MRAARESDARSTEPSRAPFASIADFTSRTGVALESVGLTAVRRQFVDGPVLVMPGGGSGVSDSRGAVVIPDAGTVYFGPFRMSGPWGTIEADKGVLVATDGRTRRVPAPVRGDEATISGDGWTFKAAAGWVIRAGARQGDYEVVRQQR